MKLTVFPLLSCILMLSGVGFSEANKKPKAPGLTYLYTVNITGGEVYNVGPGPHGTRLVVPILNGNFAGPKLKGKSIPKTSCKTSHSAGRQRRDIDVEGLTYPQVRSCRWEATGR